MSLQHNSHLFFADLTTVIKGIKGVSKALSATGAKVALAAFTRLTVFMRFLMTAQGTSQLHCY
jgi:hypothetical protein